MNTTPNADSIARFVVEHRHREYPPEVLDAARQCLVDWFGVCLGALNEPPAVAVHRMVSAWGSQGVHACLQEAMQPQCLPRS